MKKLPSPKDIVVKLIGTDGNAFALMGKVLRALKENDFDKEAAEFSAKAMSGDYNNLLQVCMDTVTVVMPQHPKHPIFKPGSKIRLVSMGNDPVPIKPGTKGTVIDSYRFGKQWQIEVRWDNGRKLSLIVPPDHAEVLK